MQQRLVKLVSPRSSFSARFVAGADAEGLVEARVDGDAFKGVSGKNDSLYPERNAT